MKTKLYLLTFLIFNFSFLIFHSASAQTTEGTDFWVTLLRSDADNPTELSLTFSTKAVTNITVTNPYTNFVQTLSMGANEKQTIEIDKSVCYVGTNDNEKKAQKALHIIADNPISLIAANYRNKSFDVAAVLPTAALKDEYRIQCYTPSDHENKNQGSHFAIVATEDYTIVDYIPTVLTYAARDFQTQYNNWGDNLFSQYPEYQRFMNYSLGDMLTTDTLMAGEVWYVWTGENEGDEADLSGTVVKARNGKPIAVFNGNPHTNIPYDVRDRDHIYSQAMPIEYWGAQFALVSTQTTIENQEGLFERIDKVRVMALDDGTEVRVNGELLHTFDFTQDTKHFFEFEFGTSTDAASVSPSGIQRLNTTNCYIETSCPCGVHTFLVSNRYDHKSGKYCNGDPAQIWINPIEQQISDITFGTFETQQVKDHFVNIVTATANVGTMTLDGDDISAEFAPMTGNANYSFARMKITNATHRLLADSGFIANVYGFGEKESYAYPAGAKTIPLTQSIIINGEVFTPESTNTLCGDSVIHFSCDLNYEFESIYWNFGDGADTTGVNSVDHYYPYAGTYEAYVLIERLSTNLCRGQLAVDSIPFTVTIGRIEISIDSIDDQICGTDNQFKVYYSNPSRVELTGENCQIEFDDAAKAQGFDENKLTITTNTISMEIPEGAERSLTYGLIITLTTNCGTFTDTLTFRLNEEADKLIAQRWNDILAVLKPQNGSTYSAFQWYRNGAAIEGETTSVLDLNGQTDFEGEYYVCISTTTGETFCSCPMKFTQYSQQDLLFEGGNNIEIQCFHTNAGQRIQVLTDIEATAQWIDIQGHTLQELTIPAGGTLISAPENKGLYILHVTAEKLSKTFKILVL